MSDLSFSKQFNLNQTAGDLLVKSLLQAAPISMLCCVIFSEDQNLIMCLVNTSSLVLRFPDGSNI